MEQAPHQAIYACAALAVLGAIVFVACDDTAASHIYRGRPYDIARDCLDDTGSVDVVSGPDTSLGCDPTCLISTLPEAGDVVFASTQCPPFPEFFDVSGKDPRCAKAIAAVNRSDICNDDGGGSSNPIVDAGPDGD
jgi:hypothetical protein